jgi:hypothetical protein
MIHTLHFHLGARYILGQCRDRSSNADATTSHHYVIEFYSINAHLSLHLTLSAPALRNKPAPTMAGERRAGLTRHNAPPLLKVVGRQNRRDYDRARNLERCESSDSSPDRSDISKLKPAFPNKKRQRLEDDTKAMGRIPRVGSIDDLANANAPTAAAGVGGRSRQTSIGPSRKGRPEPASRTTGRTLALSEEELESTSSFSTHTFFGGIHAGKDILQAMSGATQTYSRGATKEPDSTWDGYESRKKSYKNKPAHTFSPNSKSDYHFPYSKLDADGMYQGAAYKTLKASKPPNTNASDSDTDAEERESMSSKTFRTVRV